MQRDEHVRDVERFGDRAQPRRHQPGGDHSVAPFRSLGHGLELHRHQVGRRLRRIGRRQRLLAVQHVAQRTPHRNQRYVGSKRKLGEVRRRAQPHLNIAFLQPNRERDHRFDVAA
jgi:hypothetical protein